MTASEATLLILIVIAVALSAFLACGIELHHLAHHIDRELLQQTRFGG